MTNSHSAPLASSLRRQAKAWGTLLLLATTGCATGAGLQDAQYCLTNKTRAEISWLSSCSWSERRELGSDYAAGYKAGFYSASTGRGCQIPTVPPPCYWSTKYQDCEGQACIQAWFRGYQCGVAAAQCEGYPAFHKVPVGPCAPTVNVTGCQGCASQEGCHCQSCTSGQCQDKCEHEFHGGLFGQFGGEITQQTPVIEDAADRDASEIDKVPPAPAPTEPANSKQDATEGTKA